MATDAKLEGWHKGIRRMVESELIVTTPRIVRVGFILPAGNWLGGKNYLRNLFIAIRNLPHNPITPVVLIGKRQHNVSDFQNVETLPTSVLDRMSPSWLLRKILTKITTRDFLVQGLLQKHGISVLSHSSHLGGQTAIRTVGWIPDFQHVHMPQLFTAEELAFRNSEFTSMCKYCDKVIVSSKCAQEDLLSFSPENAYKAELLRFVATPVPLATAASLADLKTLYNFSEPFFLLPNQFWAHKNHRIVIDALRELKRRNLRILILATGSTHDYRNPSFYPSLMKYASESNVTDCFRVLGQIPMEHLAGLMRYAVAFINPSRFEGWSTSVEEAKSMGKQIVLSDIPVHREQAPDRGFFFPAEDAVALAEALSAAANGFDESQDAAYQDAARSRFPERLQNFGEAYLRIVSDTL
jgi:glycosyltransferase involved in cell wall biosynthesis